MKLDDKKVLITGADGFIGSHLVERLLSTGCSVRAFVCYNSFNSWGWIDSFSKIRQRDIEIVQGDVRDPHGVQAAVKNMDIVFHLAALIAIPYSYHSPASYVETNVNGTLNVLQACRDADIERVIVTSTSEVYGTARYVPIDERHPLQGQSPYAATKIAADKMAESFHRSFGMPVIIARPFNTYGPRQSARAIIPTIITQLLAGKKVIHLGSLHPTRDLNYVADTCEGFLKLAMCDGAVGREVNIGSGAEISIGDLAEQVVRLINPRSRIVSKEVRKRPANSEVERLLCDNSLIRDLTAWVPKVSLTDGLHKTIEWFKDDRNLKRYKSDIYNI